MAPSAQLQRAIAAVKAMRSMGFDQVVAKTVLKNLLKVYENKWEYIEAENYRLLVDAILDFAEFKNPEANEKVSTVLDEHVRPLKRLRRMEDSSPSQLTVELESCNVGRTSIGEMDPPQANNFEEPRSKLGRTSSRMPRCATSEHGAQPGNDSFGLQKSHQRDEQYLHGRSGDTECYKKPKIESDTEVLQENSPIGASTIVAIQDETQKGICAVANSSSIITHSTYMQHSTSNGNAITFQVSAQNEPEHTRGMDSANVHIASSSTGKVKLSLTYSFDCQNFKIPSIESVFKLIEDRCLKSYKNLQPKFSLVNLMKEICQSAADLAAESGNPQEDAVMLSSPQESLNSSRSPGIYPRVTRKSFNGTIKVTSFEISKPGTNDLEANHHIDCDRNCAIESTGNNILQTLAVHPLHESAVIASAPRHDEYDIAKGEEKLKISLVNDFTSAKAPPYFHYISGNVIYQNANVNFSLARIGEVDCCINCFGNCLSAPIPCACTRAIGGEFVYTPDGLLKKEFLNKCISLNCYSDKHHHAFCKNCPIEKFKGQDTHDACKGHLVKKFIKECWSKCGCNKQCGNRVVQRGITHALQVFYTPDGRGWGLRTLEELPIGAFVCEYIGEILTSREHYDRTMQNSCSTTNTYSLLLDFDWGSQEGLRDEEALCLDATFFGNVGRFVNHRCFDANLVEVPVEWETPDHHYYHLAFFTTRKVEPLEELTRDYGIDFKDRAHPVKSFKCLCRSRFCRDSYNSKTKVGDSSSN